MILKLIQFLFHQVYAAISSEESSRAITDIKARFFQIGTNTYTKYLNERLKECIPKFETLSDLKRLTDAMEFYHRKYFSPEDDKNCADGASTKQMACFNRFSRFDGTVFYYKVS